jgi:hypothetical protein
MTVCTNDVALRHLVEYRLPAVVAQTLRYTEALLRKMIEL